MMDHFLEAFAGESQPGNVFVSKILCHGFEELPGQSEKVVRGIYHDRYGFGRFEALWSKDFPV